MIGLLPVMQVLNTVADRTKRSRGSVGPRVSRLAGPPRVELGQGFATVIPEFSAALYEHDSDEEEPMLPRSTLDVRTLEFEGRREGMGPFRCVESDHFHMVVGVVIVFNIIVIMHKWVHSEDADEFWLADQIILLFYITEVGLRWFHFRLKFVFDRYRPWTTAANWSDLLIVLVGVLDQWVLSPNSTPHWFYDPVRSLRVLRLIRVFRLVQTLMRGDFRWTEGTLFQSLVGLVIAFNAFIIGLETDIESPAWWWIEQMMLVFFVFEIIVRIRRGGRHFFTDEDKWWSWFDLFIVASGVVDEWCMPVFSFVLGEKEGQARQGIGQMMTLVRMLRLMRILRLLRLVKSVRPLYQLALGIMHALQGMFWALVLAMVALYAFAILATRLFGHTDTFGDVISEDTRLLFCTVPASFFTLFGLMNGQYWHEIFPIFIVLPWTKMVWVFFTILSSWALLSVMTGVVSDSMHEARTEQEQKGSDQVEEMRSVVKKTLKEVFIAADKDGSGELDRKEYLDLLSSPFHVRKLQSVAHVPVKDMVSMFDWIDVDQNGRIDLHEFLLGFDWLNDPVTGKSLLKLESAMKRRVKTMEKEIDLLHTEMLQMQTVREDQVEEAERTLQLACARYEEETRIWLAEAEVAENQAAEHREVTKRLESELAEPPEPLSPQPPPDRTPEQELEQAAPTPPARPKQKAVGGPGAFASIAARLRNAGTRRGG